jgi:hypothetical protein
VTIQEDAAAVLSGSNAIPSGDESGFFGSLLSGILGFVNQVGETPVGAAFIQAGTVRATSEILGSDATPTSTQPSDLPALQNLFAQRVSTTTPTTGTGTFFQRNQGLILLGGGAALFMVLILSLRK